MVLIIILKIIVVMTIVILSTIITRINLKELFKIHVKVNLYNRKNFSLLSLEVHVKCLFLLSGGFRFGFLQR